MKYSLTIAGAFIAIVGTLLVSFGLSQTCSNEIVSKIVEVLPAVIGGTMSWIGRVRAGGVNIAGFKKA